MNNRMIRVFGSKNNEITYITEEVARRRGYRELITRLEEVFITHRKENFIKVNTKSVESFIKIMRDYDNIDKDLWYNTKTNLFSIK